MNLRQIFEAGVAIVFFSALSTATSHSQTSISVAPQLNQINADDAVKPHQFSVTFPAGLDLPGIAELALELDNGVVVRFGTAKEIAAFDRPIEFAGKFQKFPDHFKGNARFVVDYRVSKGSTGIRLASGLFPVHIDILPPRIVGVRAIEDNFGARALVVILAEENPKDSYPAELFSVKTVPGATDLLETPSTNTFSVTNGEIIIALKQSVNSLIQVEIKALKDKNDKTVVFADSLGNKMEAYQTKLAVAGQRPSGPAEEYPPFVVPAEAGRHSDNNKVRPSGRVVTRVVKLYYYRDADRVTEIINRRTQQYNLANVRAKQSQAQLATEKAEDATAKRRAAQNDAENAARQTREAEHELAALAMNAEEAQAVKQQLVGVPTGLFVVPDGTGRLSLVPPTSLANKEDARQLTTVADFDQQLTGVINDFNKRREEVAELRLKEQELNDLARSLDNQESRLIRAQFLRELDAAQEDPNTYAQGDIDSVDPVMQTSVSVIGEGTIQLRGPIEGINQIRRMIHQIDTPVGQVKVDLQTIQINGEKGEELEQTVQLVEGYINAGRFLTNQSLVFLSRSVAEVAAEVAQENGQPWERDQMGRDMRYLYGFFGQDFVDTLYRMDSEFLHTENQILSLHSMDSISRNRALFLIGLAKNSVRQRILERFQQYILNDLATMEFEYRMINKAIPCQYLPDCREECKQKMKSVFRKHQCDCPLYTPEMSSANAAEFYKFLNFQNFFAQGDWQDATLNPMQREFIRLAQIYKSQLIAEIELKQRIVERGLMNQKISDDEEVDQTRLLQIRKDAVTQRNELMAKSTSSIQEVAGTVVAAMQHVSFLRQRQELYRKDSVVIAQVQENAKTTIQAIQTMEQQSQGYDVKVLQQEILSKWDEIYLQNASQLVATIPKELEGTILRSAQSVESLQKIREILSDPYLDSLLAVSRTDPGKVIETLQEQKRKYDEQTNGQTPVVSFEHHLLRLLGDLQIQIEVLINSMETTNKYVTERYDEVLKTLGTFQNDWMPTFTILRELEGFIPRDSAEWRRKHQAAEEALREMVVATIALKAADDFLEKNRLALPQLKLLDHLIDEHEEKSMDLLEGTRAHISSIDNFLKRMTFALEDDFQVQFYDPNFVCIRTAARGKQVALSQVERTTVLGNNRELMKVLPQATMEFDLPKRQIRVAEAMQGAKALVDDYGALLKDPTFLAAYQLAGGGVPADSVRNMLPSGLSNESAQQFHALPATQSPDRLGSSLQSLVPDPEIYQFETGTGFEVRPVIQPDGDSLVYDLTYLYTTELREPVRADEKHLGRVKRHFIHTQVQTSSYELREVGRYQVALKAARTSRGVPMLENAPVVGGLFRPAPSEESSIQQNIILGRSVVYPTLYDLMGLAWAQHVAELGYDDIRNAGHVARGRQQMVRQHVFDESSRNVDTFLQIGTDEEHYRPDLYRAHQQPSPYHPNGYVYPDLKDDEDMLRRGFRVPDRRPERFRMEGENGSPAEVYDDRFRRPVGPVGSDAPLVPR
ncbi:MAG: hypothetical protein JNL67_03145 [Planctomycetaceae bacterium]|nr:hypothetical protein [Planctomycetaceae bacterium]